tara:strand:+ start:2809 stop:3963 length:1155 start_codon:yes stop_codon:yes gene_type:complete
MSYYLLPKTSNIISKYLECSYNDEIPQSVISLSLSTYLYELKEKIEKEENNWSNFKKFTNPYEYIHSVIPNKKHCISKYIPLSRSFFKMVEIIDVFKLCDQNNPINSFHLAEGPGGFIEAIVNKRNNKEDKYYGITLLNDQNDNNIPAWKKSQHFLNNNKNVFIEHGVNNNGDILDYDNLSYCISKYNNKFEFITADGGFDFSIDFNKQEINIVKLLFAQITWALTLQKQGGHFILKIFDCFMQHTIDIIYILSSCYDKVYIIKPFTSRHANSEKYIVCKNFNNINNEQLINNICTTFKEMINIPNDVYIDRFLNIPISNFFITKLEEFNAILGQQQLENIHNTITLINNKFKQEKIDTLLKSNLLKSINWCIKHNIPYNDISV